MRRVRAISAGEAESQTPPVDPKHAEIYARIGRGESATDIAREMDMPLGEVELIVSLERSAPA